MRGTEERDPPSREGTFGPPLPALGPGAGAPAIGKRANGQTLDVIAETAAFFKPCSGGNGKCNQTAIILLTFKQTDRFSRFSFPHVDRMILRFGYNSRRKPTPRGRTPGKNDEGKGEYHEETEHPGPCAGAADGDRPLRLSEEGGKRKQQRLQDRQEQGYDRVRRLPQHDRRLRLLRAERLRPHL